MILISRRIYSIAGISLEIEGDPSFTFNYLDKFAVHNKVIPDTKIVINHIGNIKKPHGKIISEGDIKWVSGSVGTNALSASIYREDSGTVIYRVDADKDWRSVSVSLVKGNIKADFFVNRLLSEIVFRNRILYYRGISIHSSSILWNGKGIIFTAPSGTGKSTQMDMWKKYKGAIELNDDRPAIRIIDNQTFVFGTPWGESSDNFTNSSAPLSMIVVLEQADKNSIIRISSSEAVMRILPRCFLPYYDRDIMDMIIPDINEILRKVPVFLLKCRPDSEAVEMVYQCIK